MRDIGRDWTFHGYSAGGFVGFSEDSVFGTLFASVFGGGHFRILGGTLGGRRLGRTLDKRSGRGHETGCDAAKNRELLIHIKPSRTVDRSLTPA